MQKIYFENNHSLPICILRIAKHCMNNVLSCILRKYNYAICVNPKKIKRTDNKYVCPFRWRRGNL